MEFYVKRFYFLAIFGQFLLKYGMRILFFVYLHLDIIILHILITPETLFHKQFKKYRMLAVVHRLWSFLKGRGHFQVFRPG